MVGVHPRLVTIAYLADGGRVVATAKLAKLLQAMGIQRGFAHNTTSPSVTSDPSALNAFRMPNFAMRTDHASMQALPIF